MENQVTEGAAVAVAETAVQTEAAVATAGTVFQSNTFITVPGDTEYNDMICKLCATVQDADQKVLDAYYGIGEIIQSYIDAQDSKNVSSALKKISEDVATASFGRLSELGEASLRKALKMRKMLTKEQLELAKSVGFSLRNILPLCGNNVKPEQRDEILQKVYEGQLKQTEISNEVKALNPPSDNAEKRGGARNKTDTPAAFAKKFKKSMKDLLEMQANYRMQAATALGSKDQAIKEEYAHLHEVTAEQVEELNKLWASNEKVAAAFLDE